MPPSLATRGCCGYPQLCFYFSTELRKGQELIGAQVIVVAVFAFVDGEAGGVVVVFGDFGG